MAKGITVKVLHNTLFYHTDAVRSLSSWLQPVSRFEESFYKAHKGKLKMCSVVE